MTVPASEAALSAEGELYLYLINTGAAEGERKLLLKPNRVSIDKEKKTLTVEGITGCSEYLVSADVVDPKYGDVNGDGRIGLADAISVCKLIASAKTPAQLILADVDGDDEVTVRDVIYICRYAIGQITADDFPAEIEESKWGEFVL